MSLSHLHQFDLLGQAWAAYQPGKDDKDEIANAIRSLVRVSRRYVALNQYLLCSTGLDFVTPRKY